MIMCYNSCLSCVPVYMRMYHVIFHPSASSATLTTKRMCCSTMLNLDAHLVARSLRRVTRDRLPNAAILSHLVYGYAGLPFLMRPMQELRKGGYVHTFFLSVANVFEDGGHTCSRAGGVDWRRCIFVTARSNTQDRTNTTSISTFRYYLISPRPIQ